MAASISSSVAGMAPLTTHVATGLILGSGGGQAGRRRWAVAGRMAVAWLVALPAAGLVGGLMFWVGHRSRHRAAGRQHRDLLILVALSFYMWWRAQQQKVDHTNVNADWDATNQLGGTGGFPRHRSCPKTPVQPQRGRPEEIRKCTISKASPESWPSVGVGRRAARRVRDRIAAVFPAGRRGIGADGTAYRANPVLRALGVALFVVVPAVIVVAILGLPGQRSITISVSTFSRLLPRSECFDDRSTARKLHRESVVDWLHTGYPDGVPPKDYYPLLALLVRGHLSEDEVVRGVPAAAKVTDDNPVTATQIHLV